MATATGQKAYRRIARQARQDRQRRRDDVLRLSIEAIDEVADLFRRAGNWRFEVPALLDALEQQQLPATRNAQRATIWTGDVMRFRGRSFQHLFVIRMQDDVFPQRRVEDPILPDTDRRQLGLREIGDGRDEERLLAKDLAGYTEYQKRVRHRLVPFVW